MYERNWKMYKRKMRIDEKLYSGWWWFWQCFDEWVYCMTHPEDNGGDFFCNINTDYCAYEEDFYYD
jgi:hypothetical protein